jgi:hypothetical protein
LRGGPTPNAYQAAVGKLLDFTMNWHEWCDQAATAYFGRKREMDDWEQPAFLGYLAYGFADDKGDRAIDIFIQERGNQLCAAELENLEALRTTAWYSMFEVQEIKLDEGLELLDLATNERFFVKEKAATHQLTKYALNLAWIVELGDHYELTGSACMVPREHREPVLRAVKRDLSKARRASPGIADKVLLRKAIPGAQYALRKAVNEWRPPKLVTMDGEDILFCEAVFDVLDAEAVCSKLENHPDFEENDGGFVWLDHAGRTNIGSGPILLGQIKFDDRRLVLETNSRERLERGKQVLGERLADVARHRIDSIKDVDIALEEHRSSTDRKPTADEIPEDVQAELVSQFIQERMMAWIDEPVPMLGNKTPRQVARTKAGKEKVLAMLKDQEHIAQRMPGGQLLDLSSVYRELKL